MHPASTGATGHGRVFPETSLELISHIVEAKGTVRDSGLEELCRRYWQPVYCYFRLSRARAPDDAKDLTQNFFLWLMESNVLERYVRERGKFRAFLKAVLKNFFIKEERDAHRLKRGGWNVPVPLDDGERPMKEILADPRAQDPERAYELAWAVTLAQSAIDRVRQRWIAAGKAKAFEAFEAYDLKGDASLTYAELAAGLGLKESDVRNHLFSARSEIQKEIRRDLSNITSNPQELEEEWNELFGA